VTANEIMDVSYYGKKYRLKNHIDPTWFEQTEIIQENERTRLRVDFSMSDTEWEIYDCFLPDLLAVLKDLSTYTNMNYVMNSESFTATGGLGHIKSVTCKVTDNHLIVEYEKNV